jgi:hypothetical protein
MNTLLLFLFFRKLRTLFFLLFFFNACTRRSKLIVAHLFKNSTNNIPLLFQKTLAMASPSQFCVFNFSPSASLQYRFSALRLPSFCTPEGCTPRTPFADEDETETQRA